MRAVFHLSEGGSEARDRVIRNAANLLDDGSISVDAVAVVANGDGVGSLLAGSDRADAIAALGELGVAFKACENTLDRWGSGDDDLLPGVEVIPSGVGELVRLQEAGYGYLKP